MIRISKLHSISLKNGYFLYHVHAIKGAKSKHAGDEYIKRTKTYHRLLSLYIAMTDIGECGEKVMVGVNKLLENK